MNILTGQIAAIETVGSVAIIDVAAAGHHFTATLLGSVEQLAAWKIGQSVRLLFKETEVALAIRFRFHPLRASYPGR